VGIDLPFLFVMVSAEAIGGGGGGEGGDVGDWEGGRRQ